MSQSDITSLITRYIIGFISALLLSILAYLMVVEKWFESSSVTMAILLLLAFLQLSIQLVCFLHLGFKKEVSRDRTSAIIYTIFMMLIIVVGSIWVMRNLDYRMGMSPEAMNDYMIEQNKKGF